MGEIEKKKIRAFTDLNVWQEGHSLVLKIYKATKTYSLIDQMRRAASSITSNIAEGFGRQTIKDKIHFYYLAKGSLTELENQILIAKDVGYLDELRFREIAEQASLVQRLLQGFISKSKTFLNPKS